MGNSSSSAETHKATGRVLTETKRPVLSEREAWAIAVAWRDQLRGCVRLEEEHVLVPTTIIRSFEWVTFKFDGLLEQGFQEVDDSLLMASYARAATIAWFALSCCEGYSGTENPEFWKRVFLEFLYPENLPKDGQQRGFATRHQLQPSAAIRFFSAAEKLFPRIKLVAQNEEEATKACARIFLGRQSHQMRSCNQKLRRILSTLKPFVRAQHWTRRIPVAIDEVGYMACEALLLDVTSRHKISKAVRDLPRVELDSVVMTDQCPWIGFFGLRERLSTCDVTVKTPLRLYDIVRYRRVARSLLCEMSKKSGQGPLPRLDASCVSVYQCTDLWLSHLGVLCSALPFLKSIKTITLPTNRYSKGPPRSPASEWAWLGFAIFHPDAADNSAFTTLDVKMQGISSADLDALRRMATGNNLLRDLNSSSWIEGFITPNTKVWVDPRDDADLLHTCLDAAWISLCVPSADVLESQEWVCAVIPGYGLGWIRRRDVVETRSRPPGRSCIRALRLDAHRREVDVQKLTDLLTVLGSSLTTLNICHSEALLASTVETIARLCPALKCLQIQHDGSFSPEEGHVTPLTCLQELQLTFDWKKSLELVIRGINPASMPQLKALRLVGWFRYSMEQQQLFIESVLRQHRYLQYFHMSHRDRWLNWIDDSYDDMHKVTRMFRSGFSDPSLDFCDFKLTLECRLAFLSVGHHSTRGNGIGRLAREVVSLIFDYATSTKQREIFISGVNAARTSALLR